MLRSAADSSRGETGGGVGSCVGEGERRLRMGRGGLLATEETVEGTETDSSEVKVSQVRVGEADWLRSE